MQKEVNHEEVRVTELLKSTKKEENEKCKECQVIISIDEYFVPSVVIRLVKFLYKASLFSEKIIKWELHYRAREATGPGVLNYMS